ncbi:hypothetical protein BDN72DRAFT_902913 [Pluteus cervinus]|uniref:Uncharacterized protein n=1 Tax=Pluteus cervinus TaxID=181527 RepID=A0ACD3AAR9_9AGAR|nr:hypothetical protein BDN72DRAFT_902913 [Pluteus cervinus]
MSSAISPPLETESRQSESPSPPTPAFGPRAHPSTTLSLRVKELQKVVEELQEDLYGKKTQRIQQLNDNITQLFNEVLGIKRVVGSHGPPKSLDAEFRERNPHNLLFNFKVQTVMDKAEDGYLERLQEARKQTKVRELQVFVTQLQSQMLDVQENMRQTYADVRNIRNELKIFEAKMLSEVRGLETSILLADNSIGH